MRFNYRQFFPLFEKIQKYSLSAMLKTCDCHAMNSKNESNISSNLFYPMLWAYHNRSMRKSYEFSYFCSFLSKVNSRSVFVRKPLFKNFITTQKLHSILKHSCKYSSRLWPERPSLWTLRHLTQSKPWRARSKTRKEFPQTSKDSSSLESNLKTEEACLITTSKRSQPSTWCSDWEVETEHDPMNNLFKQFFFRWHLILFSFERSVFYNRKIGRIQLLNKSSLRSFSKTFADIVIH